MNNFKIQIEPMGAVRMTRRGKFTNPAAQRYLDYKQDIYYQLMNQVKREYKPLDGPVGVSVRFLMPIPQSWSKKKKAEAVDRTHVSKPDIDNLIKGVFDAANGLLWIDDNRVAAMVVSKVYSKTPGIELNVYPIGGQADEGENKKEKAKQAAKRG